MAAPSGGSGGRLTSKIFVAALTALTAAGLGLIQAGLWQPSRGQRATLVATAALVAFVTTTGAAVGEWRSRRAEAKRDDLALVLAGAAWAVHDLTGIDVRELGLAVYRVRRQRLPPFGRILARVHRERAARRPTTSGIVWRPGMGVIGQCVAVGADVGQDVGADSRPWLDVGPEQWPEVPEHVRAGLTYEEFAHVRGKYHVVLATPVIVDAGASSRVVGCVALDGPEGSYDLLWTGEVRWVLADTAITLRQFVLGGYGG